MRLYSDEKLTPENMSKLGLAGSLATTKDAGFIDFSKPRTSDLDYVYLGLENTSTLRKTRPRIVLRRDQVTEDYSNTNDKASSVRTWRFAVENEYFYTKYTVKDLTDSNLAFVDLSKEYYSANNNSFFNKFDIEKTSKSINNDFPFVRLRYPNQSSNTYNLTIQTGIGNSLTIRPKEAYISGKSQPIVTEKSYYQWHKDLTTFKSGQSGQSGQFPELRSITRNKELSGFYIPYPNTLDIQEFYPYNCKLTIAPKFNEDQSQKLNGLLTIAIGNADKKEIVYVSPHSYRTGFANSVETIEYAESSQKRINPLARFTPLKLSSGYQSGVGVNFRNSGISTTYKENIARSKNGKPSYFAIDYYKTGITGYVPKQIFWNGNQWIVSGSGIGFAYSSAQDIFVNTPTKQYYLNIPALTDFDGKYEEVGGIDKNKYGRVWEKNISTKSWFTFNKSVIFWDKGYGFSPLYTPASGSVYVSTMAAPNSYSLGKYDGGTGSTGSFYYRFDKAPSQGNRIVNINPPFFDGWHLPFVSGATFLNSFVLPYISGKTVLATGVFINTGSNIVTGTFWSGSGFTYITGAFYDFNGNLFSGQIISGNNTVKIFNTLKYRTITNLESGIITGFQPFYINATGWSAQVKYITGYSGASGFSWDSGVNHNIGIVVPYNYYAPSTYSSVEGQGVPFASGAAMISGKPYISGQDYSNKPILGITGFVYVYSGEQYYTTEAVSGFYEKYAGVVFADPSGNNKIIYDTFGDYGYPRKWIFINETNPRISGIGSGYDLLFVNRTQEACPAILPRVMGWQFTGSINSGNIQINNIRATVSGGYVIARLPSSYGTKITNEILDKLSTDGYPYCITSRSGPVLRAEPRLILRNRISTGNSQNPYSQITPSEISPIYTKSSGISGAPITDWIYGLIDAGSYQSSVSGGQNYRGVLLDTATSGYIPNSPLDVSTWINNQSLGFYGNIKITNGNIIKTNLRRKIDQPIQVKSIFLDSEYLSGGNVLPKGFNYIEYTSQVTDAVRIEFNTELLLDGGINSFIDTPPFEGYLIDNELISDQEIIDKNINIEYRTEVLTSGALLENFKQTTPLKDTLFYKFYNHLYDKGKTIATGTWDGIIPSGAYFSVELISTKFNENFGLSENLGVYYADNNSGILNKIKNIYSPESIEFFSDGTKIKTNIDGIVSYTAYSTNSNYFKSKMTAKRKARKKLNQKLNHLIKYEIPDVIYKNSTFLRLENFRESMPAQKTQFNSLNIPTGNILIEI